MNESRVCEALVRDYSLHCDAFTVAAVVRHFKLDWGIYGDNISVAHQYVRNAVTSLVKAGALRRAIGPDGQPLKLGRWKAYECI